MQNFACSRIYTYVRSQHDHKRRQECLADVISGTTKKNPWKHTYVVHISHTSFCWVLFPQSTVTSSSLKTFAMKDGAKKSARSGHGEVSTYRIALHFDLAKRHQSVHIS